MNEIEHFENHLTKSKPATNSRFAKAGVSCFYDSEELNSSFVHLIKYSAEKPPHREVDSTAINI
jgi:hypothetical protein